MLQEGLIAFGWFQVDGVHDSVHFEHSFETTHAMRPCGIEIGIPPLGRRSGCPQAEDLEGWVSLQRLTQGLPIIVANDPIRHVQANQSTIFLKRPSKGPDSDKVLGGIPVGAAQSQSLDTSIPAKSVSEYASINFTSFQIGGTTILSNGFDESVRGRGIR
jgi:hypothetical protein